VSLPQAELLSSLRLAMPVTYRPSLSKFSGNQTPMTIQPGIMGELLIRSGVIDVLGLNRAQAVQSKASVSLGKALADLLP
jgi:hypothetical protein